MSILREMLSYAFLTRALIVGVLVSLLPSHEALQLLLLRNNPYLLLNHLKAGIQYLQ